MDQTTLFVTRWIPIGVGGLFSWSMIDLVLRNRLSYYLADQKFTTLVILGGVLLMTIVLLRVRTLLAKGAEHSDHHHDHDHGGDHEHSHEVSLWRYVILSMPLMIILMGLAPRGLSMDAVQNRMTRSQKDALGAVPVAGLAEGRKTDGEIINTDARVLESAKYNATARAFWESKESPVRARLQGEFLPDQRFPDRYRLTRFRITCCVGDASPMLVVVLGKPNPEWRGKEWIEVIGPVSFIEVTNPQEGTTEVFPVVHQQSAELTTPRSYIQ